MKIKEVFLFTNRNCLVFNEKGDQIAKYQKAISCYELDKKIAMEVSEKGEKFYIARWGNRNDGWCHEIPRNCFQYLLGIRTREMDIVEMEKNNG